MLSGDVKAMLAIIAMLILLASRRGDAASSFIILGWTICEKSPWLDSFTIHNIHEKGWEASIWIWELKQTASRLEIFNPWEFCMWLNQGGM